MNPIIAHFVRQHLILHPEAITSHFAVARLLHQSAEQAAREVFRALLEELLDLYVTRLLDRAKWRRRRRRDRGTTPCHCRRCGSQMRRHFVRNGHYRRAITTTWGHIRNGKVPMLRCAHCGGYVAIRFPFLPNYLRIWSDLMEQTLLDGALGLSLRQQQHRLEEKGHFLSLHTLNRQINRLQTVWPYPPEPLSDVPPVVQFNGIYFGVMERTRQWKRDARGRKRLCIFHKLQRVGHRDNLIDLGHRAEILREAAALWEIPDRQIIYQRLKVFRSKWEDREPRSVRSLLRNFSQCLTYLEVDGLDPGQFARTTGHAERLMREPA